MPMYTYVALNENGHRVRGSMNAANEMDLEDRLSSIGLDMISNRAHRTSQKGFRGSVKLQDLVVFCIHLERLERAGVPILDALSDLRDSADSPALKSLMTDIYESVRNGSLLSQALEKHPKVFDEVFVGLVSTGENTGNLHEIFAHIAKHLKWVDTIHRRIRKAIYYPIFLLILMSGIISLMMLFVIPKLTAFLLAQNFDLPMYTKALIATSNFFTKYWIFIFAAPFVLTFFIKLFSRLFYGVAYFFDTVKLHIPWIGGTIRKIELARFCRFFSITFRSGIGILQCLEIAQNVIKNRVIRESITAVRRSVSEGTPLTQALRVSGQFPNLVLRMFKVGEDSGNLDVTLENVNFFYDTEVEDSVSAMVGIIQPALTIVMGGLMLWISMAVFGPLYNSFSKMSF